MMEASVRGFLLDRQSSNATDHTIQWHKSSIGKFSMFLGEHGYSTNPNDWSVTTLREFIVWLKTTPNEKTGGSLTDTSIRTYVNSVWAFCKWLYNEEIIDVDLTRKAKKPNIPYQQKSPFTNDELKKMLNASKRSLNHLRDTAILSLLLDSGLRASEVCNLTIGDFLTDQHLLLVREGKGRKDRAVPVSVKATLAITRYLSRVRGSNLSNDVSLFVNQRGGKMTPNGLLQMVYRIAEEAGIEDAHPHRFRHTFALHFLRNGGDPLTLQRILGHTTLEMTDKYVNMLTDDISIKHAKASPLSNLK